MITAKLLVMCDVEMDEHTGKATKVTPDPEYVRGMHVKIDEKGMAQLLNPSVRCYSMGVDKSFDVTDDTGFSWDGAKVNI